MPPDCRGRNTLGEPPMSESLPVMAPEGLLQNRCRGREVLLVVRLRQSGKPACYCDRSHKGTTFTPMKFDAEQSATVSSLRLQAKAATSRAATGCAQQTAVITRWPGSCLVAARPVSEVKSLDQPSTFHLASRAGIDHTVSVAQFPDRSVWPAQGRIACSYSSTLSIIYLTIMKRRYFVDHRQRSAALPANPPLVLWASL